MPFYYYFILMIAVLLIIYLVRSGAFSKNSSLELFNEALREENSGDFKAAFINYEQALIKAEKNKFHGNLKNRIHEKLKVLHTIIEYEESMELAKRMGNKLK